ncbi:leucyl aminopeptidase [Taurinivorans muris]|uniref:Probable cytosol aminopeptidase n=1 Tax=Taurinivorans muris TaxID=2787751 RepID=A0ABY5XZM7_9BACT|nr:leucyl aminopeptidase [Desulfovibrionaceae bacterium LT0009]
MQKTDDANLDIEFQIQGQWKTDLALAFAFEGEGVDDACHFTQNAAPWLSIAPQWRDFKGKKDERIVLYGPPAMEISRCMVLGLGETKDLTLEDMRFSFAKAVTACQDLGLEHIGIDIVSMARIGAKLGVTRDDMAKELALAAKLALYSYTAFKKKTEKPTLRKLFFLLDDDFCDDSLKKAVRYAEAEALGIYLARDLANAPANAATPDYFAQKAEETALYHNFQCTVLKKEEIENENMRAFLAVAKGSAQEPRFVILEYRPHTADKEMNPLVLVGKGITFDSGGICLKPSAGMEEMKGDMSGAAAVLGAFETLGRLGMSGIFPKRPVIGVMPLCENMPSGTAVKPGDIVFAKTGKSIEIINTDAEGRLILADALAYAEEKYQPHMIVDIATLTGACAVALGEGAAGVFSPDDNLARNVAERGSALFERSWQLPVWKHLMKELKSNVADIKNAGSRYGGSLTAALFLKEFVGEEQAWVHIDMAAADNADNTLNPKGATGFGVRTLVDLSFME